MRNSEDAMDSKVSIFGFFRLVKFWGPSERQISNRFSLRLELVRNCQNTLDEFQPQKVSVYFSKSKHSQRSKIIKAGLCNSEHALSMSSFTQVANCTDLPS